MEKVSAVITTCNRIEYLKKAINSVYNQTYSNIEIIVVDDGSTDGTKEYCEKEEKIKYIYIPKSEHKNGNYARNLGIKNSSGEFVAFLDDDDEWMPTKIEKQIKEILKSDRTAVVYTGQIVEVNEGQFYYKGLNKNDIENCAKTSLYRIFSVTSTMLFKKRCLYDVGLFDENVRYWQETELMIRLCQKYQIAYVDDYLVLYRKNLNDKKRLTNNIDGFLEAVEYINTKFSNEISKLSSEEKKLREKLIYLDVADRYSNLKMNRESRKYLLKVLKLYPSLKNLIKYVFNITGTNKLKFKLFINKYFKFNNKKAN